MITKINNNKWMKRLSAGACALLFPLSSLLFPLSSLLLISCSLDEDPRDQILEEAAYGTAKEIFQNTVATLYNYIGGSTDGQGLQGTCRCVYDLQTFGSDEAMLPTRGGDWFDGGLWQSMYRHSWNSGLELGKNSWLYLYKVITLCNNSLEQIDAHRSLLTDSQMKAWKAEVRAIRAIYYWYLLDLFGRVPIITTSEVTVEEVMQRERSDLFQFVFSELMEVLPFLPDGNSAQRGDCYGRVTKPVANFVLAKLMLNAEVYTDDDWTDGERPDGAGILITIDGQTLNAWEAAVSFCDSIEDNGFWLEDEYESNFAVYNESSKENIWTIPMDKDLYQTHQENMVRSWHYRHASAYGFGGENGTCATLRTLQVFGCDTEEEDNRFFLNYWTDVVYDRNVNPVLDASGNELCYYPWEVDMDVSASPYVEVAGARMKKYEIDLNATKDGKLMDNDIVLFRFADVLLMRAEAYLRNGQPERGQADFDAVRSRAKMPLRPLTLENLSDERLMELCWEGWRRQDMIRFGEYESLFKGNEYFDKVDERDGHTTVFPIPADIMVMDPYLKQNPGY